MPSRISQATQVGTRKVELAKLTKVLFPEDHIVKAQLIEYHFKIAPTISAHVEGRPLSLVRYPDGVSGESFFATGDVPFRASIRSRLPCCSNGVGS